MIDASFSMPDRPFVKAPIVPLVHPSPSRWSPMERAKTKPSVFLIASCRSRKGSVFFTISAPAVGSVANLF